MMKFPPDANQYPPNDVDGLLAAGIPLPQPEPRHAWYCRHANSGCGGLVGYRVYRAGCWGFEPVAGLLICWQDGITSVRCKCGRAVTIREEQG